MVLAGIEYLPLSLCLRVMISSDWPPPNLVQILLVLSLPKGPRQSDLSQEFFYMGLETVVELQGRTSREAHGSSRLMNTILLGCCVLTFYLTIVFL